MATDLVTKRTRKTTPPASAEPDRSVSAEPPTHAAQHADVRAIIDQDRQPKRSVRRTALLSSLGALCFFAAFPPLGWSPLGWLVLVPWILLVRAPQRPPLLYTSLTVFSVLTHLALLQWMRLGDPLMYFGWVALSVYVGCYVPLFVAVSRTAVHRFGVPIQIAVPVAWVGFEYAQAHLITGFPWYFLAHTQYKWTTLIQVADLVGTYGISFVMAAVSVGIACMLPARWCTFAAKDDVKPAAVTEPVAGAGRQLRFVVLTSVVLFTFALGYGQYRRHEYASGVADKPPLRVAALQGDFLSSAREPSNPRLEMAVYHHLTGRAVRFQPDLIVWPEASYPMKLMSATDEATDAQLKAFAPNMPVEFWRNDEVGRRLSEMSQQANAAMIVGVDSLDADEGSIKMFNSAALVRPDAETVLSRYDKTHRVPFGEYIPLASTLPVLRKFTPFAANFGIQKGDAFRIFDVKPSSESGPYKVAPVICYEDTVPHLVGRLHREALDESEAGVDLLVNLTNDGWFHPKTEGDARIGSWSTEQHLITSVFRTVETRTPMVRAVNTGVSAVIDSEGAIRAPEFLYDIDPRTGRAARAEMIDEETGKFRDRFTALLVADVQTDARVSPYVYTGDLFAGLCLLLTCGVVVMAYVRRRREKKANRERLAAIAGE